MLTHRFNTIIGNVPDDWDIVPLFQIIDYHKSGDWGQEQGETEIKVLRSTNFTNNGYLDFSDVAIRYLSSKTAQKLELKKGDLLLERSGGSPSQPVGRIGFITEDLPRFAFSNFVQLLRPNSESINQEYLGYVLYELNRSGIVERLQHQTTQMRNLEYRDYLKIVIPKPPRQEQDIIVSILKSVDEAITNTKNELHANDRLKKSLLQQLFKRGIPGRHKKFKSTKIGKIPEEWEVFKLGALVEGKITNGYSPVCPQYPTDHWILSLSALGFDSFIPDAIKPAPKNDEKVLSFILKPGDLLVSRSNTPDRVGFVGLYTGNPPNCSYPDLIMRFRVDESKIEPEFIEQYLRTDFSRRWLTARASGTSGSMVKIKRRDLQSLLVALPQADERKEIITTLECVNSLIKALEKTQLDLECLKRSLLQNLLTGKVRVNLDGVV